MTNPLSNAAIETLKGFEFTNLTPGIEGVEVWRCRKPGDGNYEFDITVTKRGMAVFGDIDGLLFQSGVGIHFLAGDDVAGNIHDKLEPQCQQKTFDRESFLTGCAENVLTAIEELTDDACMVAAPEFELNKATEIAISNLSNHRMRRDLKITGFDLVRRIESDVITGIRESIQGIPEARQASFTKKLHDFVDFLREARDIGDGDEPAVHEAASFLRDRAGDGIVSQEWYEGARLECPTENLMFRLYLVNQAAKRICDIKAIDALMARTAMNASSVSDAQEVAPEVVPKAAPETTRGSRP